MKTTGTRYAFGPFLLDPAERLVTREGAALDVSGRYFDALVLLVAEHGKLVSKDRLHQEVWRGIPVTDEAITQSIRSLRRALGDDASSPTYIETVPRHGYRFIAEVAVPDLARQEFSASTADGARAEVVRLGLAGVAGGAMAGLIGGLFYGFAITGKDPAGGASTVLAMTTITLLVAIVGSIGVSFGIAAARLARAHRSAWTVAGGALGGAMVGGFVKLVGVDSLALIFGEAPRGITGGVEGFALGGAIGLALVLASRPRRSLRRGAAIAAAVGGLCGLVLALAGRRMMGGSLALLANASPGTRLDLDPLGLLAGQDHFGSAAQIVAAGLEGALYAGAIVVAILWAGRQSAPEHQPEELGPGAS